AAERLIVRVRSDDQERGSGIDGRNARRGSRHVGPRRRAGCGQAEGGSEEEEEGAAAPGNDGHGGPECTISWRWIRAPARPSAPPPAAAGHIRVPGRCLGAPPAVAAGHNPCAWW